MSFDPRQLADPVFFSRLDNLELRARGIVEGFMHGLHRSPFVGFSVEFASHREYAQGDDLRHVNWKLFARTNRLYVKQFDAETNMNLYLLLDVSGSMDCRSKGISKLEYGAALAAALAHLALKQHDAVGLILLADEVMAHLPPRARPHQLQEILRVIDNTKPRQTASTARAFQQAAELCKHRGIVVILSDLFDDLDALDAGHRAAAVRQARGGRVPPLGPVGARPAAGGPLQVPRPGDRRGPASRRPRASATATWPRSRPGGASWRPMPQPLGRSRRAEDRRPAGSGAAGLPGAESEDL